MSFYLWSVRFEISYIFLCAGAVFIATDRTGIYLTLLLSVLIHELAHIVALFMFGCRIKAVKLIIGCLGIDYEDNGERSEKIVCLLAGPFANIILSAVAYSLKNEILFALNVVLAAYNLLPVRGLDGGSILTTVLMGIMTEKKIGLLLNIIALIISAMLFTVFIILLKNDAANYSLLLFSIYLLTPLLIKKIS